MRPKSLWTVLKWRFGKSDRQPWPKQNVPSTVEKPDLRRPTQDTRWTFVNHATWLIQVDGVNILTDPIWSKNAGPTSWLGPKRVREPGIRFEDLPPIHAVLLSHNHYDHMDIATLQRLETRDHPLFIVGLGNKTFLEKFGLQHVQELDWWQSTSIVATTIHFVPSHHWSRRGWDDTNKTLWGGYVIQGKMQTFYFSGDTGYGPHFKTIHAHFPSIDVAFLPIGAYEPRWFMKDSHVDPAEAVQAHLDLHAKRSFGMHFGTFQLSNEPIDQPAQDLATARQAAGLPLEAFTVPDFGQSFLFPRS